MSRKRQLFASAALCPGRATAPGVEGACSPCSPALPNRCKDQPNNPVPNNGPGRCLESAGPGTIVPPPRKDRSLGNRTLWAAWPAGRRARWYARPLFVGAESIAAHRPCVIRAPINTPAGVARFWLDEAFKIKIGGVFFGPRSLAKKTWKLPCHYRMMGPAGPATVEKCPRIPGPATA